MQQAEEFFRVFCAHVNAEDYSAIPHLFDYPVSIAYVEPTAICNSPPEIASVMRAQISEYRKAGVANISVEVKTDTRIETGTHFVDVIWTFDNKSDRTLFRYPASYVMREDKHGNLKAIMFAGHDTEECCAYLKASPNGAPIGVARH